tara:strand:- start:9990 stop:11333 length:1344 start_codon:yes stop_codon:yes gene_type:complete
MKFKNFVKKKYFSKLCLFLAIFILAIIIINPFEIFSYLPKYLFYLIFLLFIASFLSLFINNHIDVYLTVISISLFFSIYLAEIYLAYKNYNYVETNPNILNEKNKLNIEYDKRSKFKIFNDLKKENLNVVMAVPPLSYLFSGNVSKEKSLFPLSGISNSKTIHCNESGYYSIYKSDRYGFNNPDDVWDEQKINLIIIGDSFVHGACVNRPNDLSSSLRTNYKLNVINLGYSSNGPLIEYATLREYYSTNIEKVVWVFFEGNDILDLKFEKENLILSNYLNDTNFTQELKYKQEKINTLNQQVIFNEKKYYFKKLIKLGNLKEIFINLNNVKKKQITYNKNIKDKDILEFVEVIYKAKKFSNENNLDFYFVYLPDANRILDTNYDDKIYNNVKNELNKLGIKFIDLKKTMFGNNDNYLDYFPFKQIGHFNELGYYRMSKEIYNFIYEK